MNKIIRGVTAAGAALALMLSGATAATALQPTTAHTTVLVAAAKKSPPVTINKIGTKTVKGNAKATVKPSYKKAKNVKIKSAVLTVKKGKKTIAKNKKSVALTAGTYEVTTAVKYQYKGKTSTVSKKQQLARVFHGNGSH